MPTYDIDELYATIAKEMLLHRRRSAAIGDADNIREKGYGPEFAVRKWVAGIVGTRYRVTAGHVVRSDGRKSKQLDVIIVRDLPTAIMYAGKKGEAELVRAECVAAVGEVKSSWYDHKKMVQEFHKTVQEISSIQDGLLVKNTMRFGLSENSTIRQMQYPITGREWVNGCYTFMVALGIGKCNLANLSSDLSEANVSPRDSSVLILDEGEGGIFCLPTRTKMDGTNVCGVQCDVYRTEEEIGNENTWTTLQDDSVNNEVSAGRMLNFFGADPPAASQYMVKRFCGCAALCQVESNVTSLETRRKGLSWLVSGKYSTTSHTSGGFRLLIRRQAPWSSNLIRVMYTV